MKLKSMLTSAAILLTWALFIGGYVVVALSEIRAENSLPGDNAARPTEDTRPGHGQTPPRDDTSAPTAAAMDADHDFDTATVNPDVATFSPLFVCVDAFPQWPAEPPRVPTVRLSLPTLLERLAFIAEQELTPIIMLNVRGVSLEEQLQGLQTAADAGIPITIIELGDVEYRPTQAIRNVFPTPSAYAERVANWTESLRAAFPEAIIAAAAAPPNASGGERVQNWNEQIGPTVADNELIFSFDFFVETGMGQRPAFTMEAVPLVLSQAHTAWARYQSHPFNSLDAMPPEMEAIFASWLFESQDGAAIAGTWAESLMVTTQYLLGANDQRLQVLCAGREMNAANRFALQQTAQAMAGMTMTQRLQFSNLIPIPLSDGDSYPPVLGGLFGSGADQTGLLINLSADALAFEVEDAGAWPQNFVAFRSDPTQLVENGQRVVQVPGDLSNGRFTLPPYSIVRLHN